jgi:16S rRNA (guanine527-N7)-methyltransferase
MESPTEKLELITRYFADFTPAQLTQLAGLELAYQEWNAKINVVSRKDIDQIYLHHVLHSLSIAAIAEWTPGTQVIDIGCGGGFPTVPLAIFSYNGSWFLSKLIHYFFMIDGAFQS